MTKKKIIQRRSVVDKRTLTTAGVEYARVTRIIRLQNMHVEFRRIRTSARARDAWTSAQKQAEMVI